MPLHRRVPKRGFHNPFRVEYEVVNLDTLGERFDAGTVVTLELLAEHRLISGVKKRLKVLGRGEVGKALTVRAHKFSGRPRRRSRRQAARRSNSSERQPEEPLHRHRAAQPHPVHAGHAGGLPHRAPHHGAGVNLGALDELARQMQNNMFGLYDMFSGGNLSRVTIFALGIMPYISASIILQLLTVVWPYLEKLSKEGELGPPQDHAVHALRDDRAERRAGARHRDLPRAPDQDRRRPAAGLQPGASRSG
jgi:Preprotein translocase subunit SecY